MYMYELLCSCVALYLLCQSITWIEQRPLSHTLEGLKVPVLATSKIIQKNYIVRLDEWFAARQSK